MPTPKALEPEDDDAPPVKASYDPSLFEGVIEMQQTIDIKRLLESAIPNDRKRLAFHLFMEGVPRKTIDENTHSVAEALGILLFQALRKPGHESRDLRP